MPAAAPPESSTGRRDSADGVLALLERNCLLFWVDAVDGRVTDTNARALATTGRTAADLADRTVAELLGVPLAELPGDADPGADADTDTDPLAPPWRELDRRACWHRPGVAGLEGGHPAGATAP